MSSKYRPFTAQRSWWQWVLITPVIVPFMLWTAFVQWVKRQLHPTDPQYK